MILFRFMSVIAWLIYHTIFPTKFYGKGKLSKGNVIVASNHTANFDPVLLASHFHRPVSFMAKHTLFRTKFSNWFFRAVGCIPVNRETTDYNAMREAIKKLNDGNAFAIFPEGTRNQEYPRKMIKIKNGVALFAIKTKSPIYPVIIEGPPKLFKMNHCMVGEPFDFSEYYDKKISNETIEKATKEVEERMHALQEKLWEKLEEKKK